MPAPRGSRGWREHYPEAPLRDVDFETLFGDPPSLSTARRGMPGRFP